MKLTITECPTCHRRWSVNGVDIHRPALWPDQPGVPATAAKTASPSRVSGVSPLAGDPPPHTSAAGGG